MEGERMHSGEQQSGPKWPYPLPPYGEMTEGLQDDLEEHHRAPSDFEPKQDWKPFKTKLADDLKSMLWPEWHENTHSWVGRTDGEMKALTSADLDLTIEFRRYLITPPSPPNASLPVPTHGTFYNSEDFNGFLDMLPHYDRSVHDDTLSELKKSFDTGVRKFGTIPEQLKVVFQRPRPCQTNFLLGKAAHQHLKPVRGYTAGSPAFPSGHTIQALLGIGAVLERTPSLPGHPRLIEALQQLAVDIGNRRVFAGLHYPSDTLASWIIVLRVAPHVFRGPRVTKLLREAILSEKNDVYQRMKHVREYEPALNHLTNL